jgi:SEC-C motif
MGGKWYPRGHTVPRAKPWYKRNGGERFKKDEAIVRVFYPDLEWDIDHAKQRASLIGVITLVEPCGLTTSILTRIAFPSNYPEGEPLAYEVGHRFVWDNDHHILPDGRCCLWLQPLSKWRPNDPEALHIFLDELAVFFDRQLAFEARPKSGWPGGCWNHGVHGYWDFIVEQLGGEQASDSFIVGHTVGRNEDCPCGSGLKYKRCHLSEHAALARRIDAQELKRARNWRIKQLANNHVSTPLKSS